MKGFALAVLCIACLGPRVTAQNEAPQKAPPAPARSSTDILQELGYKVTSGAAPGYVEDRVCGLCHGEIARSYQDVGMARSFFRPSQDKLIEDFALPHFFHQKSGLHYEMVWQDQRLLFRRYVLDDEGRRLHVYEQGVDWILGSGGHSRTYLFQTPSGELYQLPIAWYTQNQSWGMAPGFDRAGHLDLQRRVRHECMFCHNAYPDLEAGEASSHWDAQSFPTELPQGIGCQRCHGPGAWHSRLALRGVDDPEQLQGTIVNPGRLSPERRNDVCYGCHMQPSVALPGVRRFERDVYSFRPGQDLSDYLVAVDIVEGDRPRSERFEINHHPYRLEQSRCFIASQGALSCLTCHDPHRKMPSAERAAHYRAACLSCHQVDDCELETMVSASPGADVDPQDCVSCHMPQRRTQDVVQVVMTDHRITRHPGGPELLAPLAERDPDIIDIDLLEPERTPGRLGKLYQTASLLRPSSGDSATHIKHLEGLIAELAPKEDGPYFDLARGQLKQRRFAAVKRTLSPLLAHTPHDPLALQWTALAEFRLGRSNIALELLDEILAEHPKRAETHYNRGLILLQENRPKEALAALQRALELRPNLASAALYLGHIHRQLGDLSHAVEGFRRALAIEPRSARAYVALAKALAEAGDPAAARRTLRQALDVADDVKRVADALAELKAR